LRGARAALQERPAGAVEVPRHRPGQQLGLVETPLLAPNSGGRGPGDDIGPPGADGGRHRRGERPDHAAPVAVLEPQHEVTPDPLEAQHRRQPVDLAGRRDGPGGDELIGAGGAERASARPAK